MKLKSVSFATSANTVKHCPPAEYPEIAFAGRSNVGKSSLMNMLLHRKNLVKTSSTPGKTQLLNFFLVNESFYFVDLPGYGYAKVPKTMLRRWRTLIEGYIETRETLRLVVVLLDARRVPNADDLNLLTWLWDHEIPFMPVITKIDKVPKTKRRQSLIKIGAALEIPPDNLLATSAVTREGNTELWKVLNEILFDHETT